MTNINHRVDVVILGGGAIISALFQVLPYTLSLGLLAVAFAVLDVADAIRVAARTRRLTAAELTQAVQDHIDRERRQLGLDPDDRP